MGNTANTVPSLSRIALALSAALCANSSHAGESAKDQILETVSVTASKEGLTQPDSSTPSTVYQVDRESMRLLDTPGGTNPYTALAEIPGVKVSTADAYGLDNMRGGQKGLRVRGEVSTHGVAGTLEGVSLGGPGPGPGYLFLFDKENIARITFAQGAVSPDRPGLFNVYGAINSELLWPRATAHADVSYSTGSNNFQRAFVRLDSGQFSTGTAFFLSASETSADKWRGYGEAPASRKNIEFAIQQTTGDLRLRLLLAHNEQEQHAYKALTYAQATNLDTYRKYDYSNNPATSDYYGFNRQDFTNQAALAEIDYDFSPTTSLSIKPYYAREEGNYLYASSETDSTQVQKWLIDHTTYGIASELRTTLADTLFKLGYSWTSTEPPGPPTTRKQYRVTGGQLVFQQWALLSRVVDRYEFSNTYLTAEHRFGRLQVNGGVRYAEQKLPAIDAYRAMAATAGATWDVSADAAIARAVKDPTRSVSSRDFASWLPQAGLSYSISEAVEVHASLGKNIGAPSFDAFNQPLAGTFTSSQQYWDQLKPETSTSLDLGARLRFGSIYLDPTIYFSRSNNKAVSVYSPATTKVYSQNVGKTEGSGLQLAAGWKPMASLQLFSALSYSRSTFRENVLTTGGAVLPVDGKQLPDVPEWMGNIGAAWQHGGWTVVPVVQYVGSRWATSNYDQKIDAYSTTDLTVTYGSKGIWGSWDVSLAALNLFDRKYIGQVSTSEINTSTSGAIYYPGAPRTLVATLRLGF
ncbi:MAG: putative TonB-dependent receptor [Proteobacteria bacterium]|nr:putative TonB-dependent receptor [Pseudomonadota bacterium]